LAAPKVRLPAPALVNPVDPAMIELIVAGTELVMVGVVPDKVSVLPPMV
jgi:hypothetical protein